MVGGHRVFSACTACLNGIKRHTLPKYALANGRWVGTCPPELQGLTYVEQLLIARNRHSFCVAQVSCGQRFLASNVIVFGQPVARMYDALPPPKKDIEECLAILFVGSAKPTDEDIRRTPFLVRLHVVLAALRWLQLNSAAYADIRISMENLATYADNEPPVGIIYRRTGPAAPDESLAVYEASNERSVDEGDCVFTVHGLSSSEFVNMTYEAKLATAIRHFDTGGRALAYGHDQQPESMYHNADLYPRMFPWLYPYGLGGFGN
ncbi:hypothetical protein OH76DRAFT_1346286, partial [Lentinus brumalis]